MFNGLGEWLGGFVQLGISGGGEERFLNLALQRGIEIWDSEWVEDELVFKAARAELGDLKRIAKLCGCRLRVGRGRGLPFALLYFIGRKGFVVGLLLFFGGLGLVSQVVLSVEISPQEPLDGLKEEQVLQLAESLGVRPGAIYAMLDVEDIEEELLAAIPELSWVEIERQGTRLDIKVAEWTIYPEELENATIGAIWANRDGLIEDVLIKQGEAVVSHGDTVQKGALLVSPTAEGRADAIVHARVWYSGYGEAPLVLEETEPVGGEVSIFSLRRNDGERLLLWGNTPEVGEEMRLCEEQSEYSFGVWGVNFCLERRALQVEQVECIEVSEAAAKQAAYEAALAGIFAQQNPASRLLVENVDYELVDGVWCCEVLWECLEEIGQNRNSTPATVS